MLASSRWLSEYFPTLGPVPEALDHLTRAGVAVESVRAAGEGLTGVVVAHLLEVAKHPQADRLSLTRVTDGKETYQVVCGAKNIAPGQKVPLALVGATLPGGLKLEKAKIRGVESFGMLCSTKELGLSEESEGILILEPDAPVGMDLKEYLGLPDALFEVEITPNRPDLLSHFGLARELSALTQEAVRFPSPESPKESGESASTRASASVEDPRDCPLYTCRVIEGVQVGPSPRWLKDRLERLGHRSINNVVDVTNFILFELGQPLHAFDLDRLEGAQVRVRRAKAGEKVPLLDGTERDLTGEALVIADASKPVALAGVMGGGNSMVTDGTKRLLLESALFHPGLIRRTARRLGISTDSSYRFERGVDPGMVRRALDRAAALLAEVTGGKVLSGVVAAGSAPPRHEAIPFRPKRCSDLLGYEVPPPRALEILKNLGCSVTETASGASVAPPSWRVDLHLEIDLVEEVARVMGYDLVPIGMPPVRVSREPATELERPLQAVRRAFRTRGLDEALGSSFLPADFADRLHLPKDHPHRKATAVLNPIAEDQLYLRPSLLPTLLQSVQLNLSHQGESVGLFEVNKTFQPSGGPVPRERLSAAAVLAGSAPGALWDHPARSMDLYDLKGLAEDLAADLLRGTPITWEYGAEAAPYARGESFRVKDASNRPLLWGGALDPKVKKAYDVGTACFALEADLEACWLASRREISAVPLPKFPAALRDLALVVPDRHPHAEIESALRASGGGHLVDVALFDLFRGKNLPEGSRSLAYRLVFQSPDRTLTDAEVNEAVARILETLQKRYEVVIR